MIPTPTLIQAAADHVVEIVMRIARGAHAFLATPDKLTPRQIRATGHIIRIFELCTLLIFRSATNPAYQPSPKPLENRKDAKAQADSAEPKSDTQANTPAAPEPPKRPERTDRADALPRGSHLSTMALVAEINRQLQLAAKALGHPLAPELAVLCHQAIEAATQLQNLAGKPSPSGRGLGEGLSTAQAVRCWERHLPVGNAVSPPTRPEPPKPTPTTTLEL